MPLNLSSGSLNLSHIPTFYSNFTIPYSPNHISTQLCLQKLKKTLNPRTISCASTGPKSYPKLSLNEKSEIDDLVRVIMRNFGDERSPPMVSTLNKYVKQVRTEHCFLLFEELGKTDKWLQCLEVFRWMQKQRWYSADNGVYSKLISVMGKKGQTRMAMWLFSEMRNSGCRPDTSVYNALITAHLHSRDKSKALAKGLGYFEKMKGMERCKPNIVTYNILLRAFAQARNNEQVDALFKDLKDSIVTTDIFTYNGVMDGYGKNGMIKEMESVLARMKSDQCKPDNITFNLLIDSYGKNQEFEKMEQVFTSLMRSKYRPTLPTFNSMITNYGKARQREKAEHVFKKMSDLKYNPSYITYESLIMMYGHCDCVSRAREIFDEKMMISGKNMKISTLNIMLDVYCMNGLAHEADTLLETMRNLGLVPDSSTYKLLYKAYTKHNMKDLLQKLLKHMDRDGIIPNKKFFLEALGVFGSSSPENPQESARTTTRLRRVAINPETKVCNANKTSNHPLNSTNNRRFFKEVNVEPSPDKKTSGSTNVGV